MLVERDVLDQEVENDAKSMVCESDPQGNITFLNRKFAEMTGFSKEELMHGGFDLIRHPDMPTCLFKKMWEAIGKGETWKGYLKVFRSDGKYFWTAVYITPQFHEDGSIKGYVAAYKKAEQTMIDTMSKLYAQALEDEVCNGNITDIEIANLACEDQVR